MTRKLNIKTLSGMTYAPCHTLTTIEGEEHAIRWMGGLFGVIADLAQRPQTPLAPGLTQSRIKVLAEIGAYLAQDTGDILEALADDIGGERVAGH